MSNNYKYIRLGFVLITSFLFVSSCRKMVETPEGTANIYLTAAANNVFSVPGNPTNYMVDKAAKKLHIPVYFHRSGLQNKENFTVNISTDNAAAQKLIDDGLVDQAKALIAPADVFTLPSSVTGGVDSSSFDVVFDANKMGEYLGKQLILSVKISDPSKYTINPQLSTLNILVDVDPIMFGARVEVTDTYIKNSGHPFIASVYDGVRRGVLAEWKTTDNVKNYAGGTLGGYDNYGNGGFMSMERYSSPAIPNGKIYQSFNLPAGKYEMTAAFLDFGVKELAYIMAAPGSSLPDITNVDDAFAYAPFTAPRIEFFVPAPQEVTIGVVADFNQDQQYFRLDKFRLYHYQSLWD